MGKKTKTLKGFSAVFCYASFFIALYSKKDTKHKRALELFKEIMAHKIVIHASWFVISEAMTILLYQYGYSETRTSTKPSIYTKSIIPQTVSVIKRLKYSVRLAKTERSLL